jgi:hypothetical protein
MALKFLLATAAYTALSDDVKALYIASDKDGEYRLDVAGLPEPEDTAPLKRALESERAAHKETKTALSTANQKIADAPDFEKLKTDHAAQTEKLTKFVDKALRDNVANSIATKISTAPSLLAPKIAERISVDMTGDEPKTVFLGADGKPNSELNAEKISQEFVANAEFKAIIIASKGSGAGSPPRQPSINPLGGVTPTQDGQTFDASKAKPAELAAHLKAKKEAAQNQS